ncbi:MAG TPA: helix-turn-helix domain-containing protein [Pyrinomonadaceae bacterium]
MNKPSDQNLEGGAREGGADGSLGEQLRRARLARGVSLREISDQTRITMRHLEAIEADEYKHLPGGIFNRSFVRAFARCVGFDDKRALDLYARTARDHGADVDEPLTSPHRSRIYTDGDTGRSPLLTFGLSALLVGILCLGIYALWYAYERRFGGVSTDGDESAQKSAAAQKGAQQSAPQSAPTPDPAAATVPDKLQVELRARDKSFWVSWRQDEDKKQKGRIISPGGPESMTLEKSINLRVGRGDVANLEVLVNGQPARLPSDAGVGDVEVLITKDNFRQFLP